MEEKLNSTNINITQVEPKIINTNISEINADSYLGNTLLLVVISTCLILIIYKLIFGKTKKKTVKDTIILAGPANTGKTCFFYTLLGVKNKDTVTSMDINQIENQTIPLLEEKGKMDLIDIPGQGFYKTKIIDNLANSKAIIIFLDSTDKESISRAADFIYDILNNEQFDEITPMIIACNKQDLKFPKSKKIIESELNNEVENIKQIKQKNNLEETSQMGALFSMRSKFNFNIFKNIHFVETDKSSNYEALIKLLNELL